MCFYRHICCGYGGKTGGERNLVIFEDKPIDTGENISPRGGAFDSAKNHKRQRRKRQSVTAKREKSQTPKILNNTNLT